MFKGETEPNFDATPGKPWWWMDYITYQMFTQVILHATPAIMVTLNVYFSDIKILRSDWNFAMLHVPVYMFANFIGNMYVPLVYPVIDWVSYPITLGAFFACGVIQCVAYYYDCTWRDSCWKRRSEN